MAFRALHSNIMRLVFMGMTQAIIASFRFFGHVVVFLIFSSLIGRNFKSISTKNLIKILVKWSAKNSFWQSKETVSYMAAVKKILTV